MEAEGFPARLRRRRFGEEGVPRGVADPLPGALDDSHREELRPGLGEREQDFHRCRESVSHADEALAFSRGVGKPAGEDFHERDDAIGRAFHESDDERARQEDLRQEERKDRQDHLAADVGEEGDDPEDDDVRGESVG